MQRTNGRTDRHSEIISCLLQLNTEVGFSIDQWLELLFAFKCFPCGEAAAPAGPRPSGTTVTWLDETETTNLLTSNHRELFYKYFEKCIRKGLKNLVLKKLNF